MSNLKYYSNINQLYTSLTHNPQVLFTKLHAWVCTFLKLHTVHKMQISYTTAPVTFICLVLQVHMLMKMTSITAFLVCVSALFTKLW